MVCNDLYLGLINAYLERVYDKISPQKLNIIVKKLSIKMQTLEHIIVTGKTINCAECDRVRPEALIELFLCLYENVSRIAGQDFAFTCLRRTYETYMREVWKTVLDNGCDNVFLPVLRLKPAQITTTTEFLSAVCTAILHDPLFIVPYAQLIDKFEDSSSVERFSIKISVDNRGEVKLQNVDERLAAKSFAAIYAGVLDLYATFVGKNYAYKRGEFILGYVAKNAKTSKVLLSLQNDIKKYVFGVDSSGALTWGLEGLDLVFGPVAPETTVLFYSQNYEVYSEVARRFIENYLTNYPIKVCLLCLSEYEQMIDGKDKKGDLILIDWYSHTKTDISGVCEENNKLMVGPSPTHATVAINRVLAKSVPSLFMITGINEIGERYGRSRFMALLNSIISPIKAKKVPLLMFMHDPQDKYQTACRGVSSIILHVERAGKPSDILNMGIIKSASYWQGATLKIAQNHDMNVQNYIELGEIAEKNGDLERAVLLYNMGVAENSAEAHYRIGRVYFRLGDLERAKKHYERAKAFRYDYLWYDTLIKSEATKPSITATEEKIAALRKAIAHNSWKDVLKLSTHLLQGPEKPQEYSEEQLMAIRATALMRLGKLKEAFKAYKELIARDEKNTAYLYTAGYILLKLGMYEKAVPFFDLCLRYSPGHELAKKALTICYRKIGGERV